PLTGGCHGRSLPALLDEPADERLGVGLQDVVDLVEQGVDGGVALLRGGGAGRGRFGRVVAPGAADLLLGHGSSLVAVRPCPDPMRAVRRPGRPTGIAAVAGAGQGPVRRATRVAASGQSARRAPAWARVPRPGSV